MLTGVAQNKQLRVLVIRLAASTSQHLCALAVEAEVEQLTQQWVAGASRIALLWLLPVPLPIQHIDCVPGGAIFALPVSVCLVPVALTSLGTHVTTLGHTAALPSMPFISNVGLHMAHIHTGDHSVNIVTSLVASALLPRHHQSFSRLLALSQRELAWWLAL